MSNCLLRELAICSAALMVMTPGSTPAQTADLSSTHAGTSSAKQIAARDTWLRLPLAFEQHGIANEPGYVAHGQHYVVRIAGSGIKLRAASGKGDAQAISLAFVGARPSRLAPRDPLTGKVNYIHGNDPHHWELGLSTWEKVLAPEMYPGVDVIYYGNQQQLEFDVVVKPGADPRTIRLKAYGTQTLSVDDSGAIVMGAPGGDMRIGLPRVYQDVDGVRHAITGRYSVSNGNEIAFSLGAWDHSRPLIIDPTIVWSALIGGGSSMSSSSGNSICLDGNGNIYIAGSTSAGDFPTSNAAQGGLSVPTDAFVSKINPSGTAFIYSTYLGGSGNDTLQSVAADTTGAAWATGYTYSNDFPTMNPVQSALAGPPDAIAVKLSPTGALVFSTYLGGFAYDVGNGVATDASNNAYVVGWTQSGDFPTSAGALQTVLNGQNEAFVVKFDSSGTRQYSTYLGGGGGDYGAAIAADSSGNAYVTGYTFSASFSSLPGTGPQTNGLSTRDTTAGPAQATNGGGGDAYVAKLNSTGSALSAFTFIGGPGYDFGQAITLDGSNNVYVAGNTSSATGIATEGAAQNALAGAQNGFIAKMDSGLTQFAWVTYVGGNRQDTPAGLGVDGSGNAYIGGQTNSNVFPAVQALQPNYPANPISVFQTTNSGTSWAPFDSGIADVVNDLSLDPVTSGTIIAATSNGIYKTTNGGSSWTLAYQGGNFNAISRSPAASSTIYALQSGNVYRSTDNGSTWTLQGTPGNPVPFSGIVADATTANTVYLFATFNGVFVSTDGGATWNPANTGLPFNVTALVAASDGSLYASVPFSGVYKSTNHGGQWTLQPGSPLSIFNKNGLLSAQGSASTLYAANFSVYVTTNGGANWSSVPGSVPGGAAFVGVSPSNAAHLFAFSNSGSIYTSTDSGATWNPAGSISTSQATEFTFDPLSASKAYVVAPVSEAGFVTAVNAAGSQFLYSTWFGAAGSTGTTLLQGLAANSAGDVFITGSTSVGSDGAYPATTTVFQGTPNAGAFVARISASTPPCSVAMNPAAQIVSSNSQSIGLSVIAPSGCNWNATSDQPWAAVIRGTSDTGTDAISLEVQSNTAGAARTATISAGSQSATITQAGQNCFSGFSPTNFNLPAAGGPITTNVVTGENCPWSVSNPDPSAITITSASSGTGNGTVNATVGQNAGLNYRTLSLGITSGSTLTITQGGSCTFTMTPGSASPSAAGGPGSFSITASAPNCTWVVNNNVPWIMVNSAFNGTGNGTVNYTVSANTGPARNTQIGVAGTAFPVNQAAAPVSITSVVNAASYALPPLAPGSDAIINGTNLAAVNQNATTTPLGSSLANASVTVNGLPAAMSFASPTQISFQIPYETVTGNANVVVNNNGAASNSFQVAIVSAAPGIFGVLNADNTANNSANADPAGSSATILFTGAGVATPPVADGAGNPSFPLSIPNATTTVTINGSPATVNSVSLAPGCCSGPSPITSTPPGDVGVAAAHITVPGSLANGSYAVVVTTNGVASAAGSIFVGSANLAAGSANLGTFTTGTQQIPLAASGGNFSYTWSLVSGSLPPGLSLRTDVPSSFSSSQQAGLLGVATTPGNYTFTLSVNSGSQSVQQAYNVRITAMNLKDSAINLPSGFVNVAYNSTGYQFTVLNNAAAVSFTQSTGLPPGMTLSATGLLSGTPTAAGMYNIGFSISDGTDTIFRNVPLNIYAFQISTPAVMPNGTQNASYTATLIATGGSGPYQFTAFGLPNGLTLDPSGAISGTVTANPGKYNVNVTATDSTQASATKTLSIDVIGVPITLMRIGTYGQFLNDATLGDPYSTAVTVCCGGTAPFTWTVSGLPAGMTMHFGAGVSSSLNNPGDAEIWGIPQTAGTYNIRFTVADSTGATTTQTLPLHVSSLDLALSPGFNLPQGTINVQYLTPTIRALGGTGPYTVSVLPGTLLPAGMTFNTTNLHLSGTPLETGGFNLNLKFTDTANPQNTLARSLWFNINGNGQTTLGVNSLWNLGTFTLHTSPSIQLMACCAASYLWSTVSGSLPPGQTLSPSGQLSGTLTTAGTYAFLLQVADGTTPSNTAFRQFTETVTPISVTSTALPNGVLNAAYPATSLVATGGTGSLTWTLNSFNSLPPGLSLLANGTISGTPTSTGNYAFNVTVTDGSGAAGTAGFVINVYVTGPPLYLAFGPKLCCSPVGTIQYQLGASGGTPPYHYSLTPAATPVPGMRVEDGQPLPTNFSPTGGTGGFIGVVTTPGVYNTSIRVTDSANNTFDSPVTLTVLPISQLASNLPRATVGTPYTFALTAIGGTGSFSWSGSNFPPGLSVDSQGIVAGTPTTSGQYSFTIGLADAAMPQETVFWTYKIAVDPFAITDSPVLPQLTVGVAYNHAFSAPGCGNGCTWSVMGSLPFGLMLSPSGTLSGEVTNTGGINANFTIQASGSAGVAQKNFTLIGPPVTISALSITSTISTTNVIGGIVTNQLSAAGGTPPYTFSIVPANGQMLPIGVTLQGPGEDLGLSPGAYYLAGRPQATGTYTFTLQVTDSAENTAAKVFTWTISPLQIAYGPLPIPGNPLIFKTPYAQPMLVLGGSGKYTSWAASAPIYPGLSLNATTGAISGSPTNTGSINSIWTVADDSGNSTIQPMTITAASNASTSVTLGGPGPGTVIPSGSNSVFNLNPSGGTPPYTVTAVGSLPAGVAVVSGNSLTMNFGSNSYDLVVNPEGPGTLTLTLQAQDSAGITGARTYSFIATDFTTPTNLSLPDGSVGSAYSAAPFSTSSGSPTWAVAPGSALPPGLALVSGVITGTPSAAGQYVFSLALTDTSGKAVFVFSLNISSLAITNPRTLPEATIGVPYSYQMTATGGTGLTWNWGQSGPGLPQGLTLSPTGLISGAISGRPAYYQPVITVTNGVTSYSARFSLYADEPNPTELDYPLAGVAAPDAVVNQSYFYQLVPAGGTPPYSWSIAPGSQLPAGISLLSGAALPTNSSPGSTVLGGYPTTAGQYNFTLIATDSMGGTVTRTFKLNVTPVNLVAGNPPNATVGTPYSEQLTAMGGAGPYTFTMTQNGFGQPMLPPGLTMSASGLISGTPTSTGSFTFKLAVQDTAGHTLRQVLNLLSLSASGLTINADPNPIQSVGVIFFQSFRVCCSASTFTWSVASGTAPAGISFAVSDPQSMQLTGNVSAAGTYSFVVRATDGSNPSNYADYAETVQISSMQFVVPEESAVVTQPLPAAQAGSQYTFTFGVAGGKQPYTFAESPLFPLPPGLALSAAGVLSGRPTATGAFTLGVTVSDSASNSVGMTLVTLLVVTPPGKAAPLEMNPFLGFNPASVGVPYQAPLDRIISGGTPPYSWGWVAASYSSLPPGLRIMPAANGVGSYISGIPTAQGNYNVIGTVTDSGNPVQSLTLPVGTFSVTSLVIAPDSMPPGMTGTPYSVTLFASGGMAPYKFALPLGTVPGLSLDSSGTLSGTPSSPGNFVFEVDVRDNGGNSQSHFFEVAIDDAAGEAPAVALSPKPVNLYYAIGSANPSTTVAASSTSGNLAFSAAFSGIAGASLSSASGTTPNSINLAFDGTQLTTPGIYSGLLAVSAPGAVNSQDAVPVVLTVATPPPCVLTVSPSSASIPAIGGTGSFAVIAGASCPPWTATPSDPSITITSGASGTGSGNITYTVPANATTGAINETITVAGQIYTINQFAPLQCAIGISPSSINATAAGGTALINVTASDSSCAWTASGLTATPASGTGSAQVQVTIPANSSALPQMLTASIGLVSSPNAFTVMQAGVNCTVSLGSPNASFSAAGGTGAVNITTPNLCTWDTANIPSWVSVTSGASGTSSGAVATLTYTVDQDSNTAGRSGTLLIAGQPFAIAQTGQACSISLDTSGLGSPFAAAGGTGTIKVNTNGSNCNWTAGTTSNWITVFPSGGAGNGTVSVTTKAANATANALAGSVVISGQNINISQAGTVCTYSLRSLTGSAPYSGGAGSVGVVAASGCAWAVNDNNPNILTVTSSGTGGTADIAFTVKANNSANPQVGTLTITGGGTQLTFTLNQAGAPCSFTLPDSTISVAQGGATNSSFSFTTAQQGCATPTPVSYANWLTAATPAAFDGTNGSVTYSVGANPAATVRSGTIQLGNQTFTVTQNGQACAFSLNTYGAAFGSQGGAGTILASESALSCNLVPNTNQPGIVTLGALSPPAQGGDIFTQPYTVNTFNSIVNAVRRAVITLGGQNFMVKQTSW